MARPDSSTSSPTNRSYVTNDGRASTFGRNLIQYIQNRLPYSNVAPEQDNLNPKYNIFKKTGMKRAEALAKASVSSSNPYNNIPIGDFAKDSSFGDVMYANIQAREYRLLNKKYNNKTGNLEALYEDEYNTPFKATLEMFK